MFFCQPRLLLLRLSRRLRFSLRHGVSQSLAFPESHPGVLSRECEHELPGRRPGVVASLAHALGDIEQPRELALVPSKRVARGALDHEQGVAHHGLRAVDESGADAALAQRPAEQRRRGDDGGVMRVVVR